MSRYDSNYDNDSRVRAARAGKWYESLNSSRMTVTVDLEYDADDYENIEDVPESHVELPIKFVVCGTCQGRGLHVNPSVDCGGLTGEDFERDPDFREEYFNGAYDVQCYECHGNRVVPQVNEEKCSNEQKAYLKRLNQLQREHDAYERECAMERRMGA